MMGIMKTIMIIDNQIEFTKRIKQSLQGENVTVLNAHTNREALNYLTDECNVDLFLVPTESRNNKKGFFACKSTDSFSKSPTDHHFISEQSSQSELKTIIKNNLSP